MADAWSAERYARDARFVSDLGAPVLDLLAPRPGERILDLGCGDGALTARIAAAGATVVGLDASPDMVAATRARGLEAHVASAEAAPDLGRFDAVFSNAALHWMTDPDAVLAGVARALRPGGRFVGEFGGHGNVAALRVALSAALALEAGVADDLTGVWFFPDADAYAVRLRAHGFAVGTSTLIPRPTPLPGDAAAWFATLAAPALALAPEAARPAVAARAQALAAPALRDAAGRWVADYVRLRFAATRAAAA